MSDLIEKSISGEDKQSFDQMRKLTACGLVLADGMPAEEAAAHADKSIFQKTVEYAVGRGEMAADAAVEAMIDRQACCFSEIIHRTITVAVETGCRVAGGWIGHFFGPVGIATGQKIGAKVAGILNTNLSPLIDKGIVKMKEVAKSIYEKGKTFIKSIGHKVFSKLFG